MSSYRFYLYPLYSLVLLLVVGCSDSSDNAAGASADDDQALKNSATFPIGNVLFVEDDARFLDYQVNYATVLNIVEEEFDYIGHDEIFRVRETHPDPFSADYRRLDAFVDFAEGEGYEIHGHNLLFYADIGANSWIAKYRRNATWSQDQWLVWFERYIREKVGRYKGRVASWDVLNEPLARAILDDVQARTVFTELAGDDIYSRAFRWARQADPDAKLILNEFFLGPGGLEKTEELIALADKIGRDGGKVDVIGFEGIYFFSPLIFTSYSYNYERFKKAADAGYLVTISELNVALNIYPAAGQFQRQSRRLHSIQRKAFNNIVRAYMDAVPPAQRWGVVTWGVADYSGFTRFGDIFKVFREPGGGSEWPLLWDDDFNKKPAYYGFMSALQGRSEPFKYTDVYDEGDLVDDSPLLQDFRQELLSQLDEERAALTIIPLADPAVDRYYEEVKREIAESPF